MKLLDGATTGDDFTAAATIAYVYDSNGGYFNVSNNDVYCQLAYPGSGITGNPKTGHRAGQGNERWTDSFHVPPGNGAIYPGTIGIRFKNYTKGKNALVSAGLSSPAEPAVTLAASGSVSSGTGMIVGEFDSAGNVLIGTGFTVTHVGTGHYRINYTNPFTSVPVLIAQSAAGGGQNFTSVGNLLTSSGDVFFNSTGGGGLDEACVFAVIPGS